MNIVIFGSGMMGRAIAYDLSKFSKFSNISIADKNNYYIQLGLKLFFKGDSLKNEIFLKKDNIIVIVKKVFKQKRSSEIITDPLKKELKKEINKILEKGQLDRVDFLNFKTIEKK